MDSSPKNENLLLIYSIKAIQDVGDFFSWVEE